MRLRTLATEVAALCLAALLTVVALAPTATARPASARSTLAAQDAAFVNAAFHDFVLHGPSASSSAYWTGRLVAGTTTRAALATYLANSSAAARAYLIRMYLGLLGRAPSDAALASRASQLTAHHATRRSVAVALLSSNEFYQHTASGSTTQWVERLYALLLPTSSATPTQVARWVALADSQGLTATAAQFYDSAGARSLRVQVLYFRMLRRPASGASLAHWADVDRAGDIAVAVPIAASTEYLNLAQTRGDPRIVSPLSLVAHVGVPATFTVSPYTYLGPPGVGLFTFPPGMTETGFATFAGTPTRAGTFHTFVILNDQTDLVIDTLTVTVLP